MATKEKQIQEGQEASMLLDNPVITNAFNVILNEGYQKWISTKPEDKEEREKREKEKREPVCVALNLSARNYLRWTGLDVSTESGLACSSVARAGAAIAWV